MIAPLPKLHFIEKAHRPVDAARKALADKLAQNGVSKAPTFLAL
ncbi:hypothetical protein [Sphingomicrobium sediminis]|nr:hypothetical protein [Sphingomicrobium sediminis]